MKRIAIALVVVLVVGDAAAHGIQALLGAINRGKFKRVVADARTVATALEAYKAGSGHYPVAMTSAELATHLSPQHLGHLPTDPLDYFSDGSTYTFILWPWGRSPYPMRDSGHGPLEVRDGTVVAWPAWYAIGDAARLVAAPVGAH